MEAKEEFVVLVDENDCQIGLEEKMKAHQKGLLHRAISIFIFNSKNEMLLQQRAFSKYHSGGLWTNTCCTHPRQGESNLDAAHRRLQEEMGIQCPLQKKLDFIYRSELDLGLIEHEFDHLFIGNYDADPIPNPEEANAWKWIDLQTLQEEMEDHPESYTPWFKIILRKVV